MTIAFDAVLMRQQLPAFVDADAYPDASLEAQWTVGTNYLSTNPCGWCAPTNSQAYALNLMAAHLITLAGALVPGSDGEPGLIGILSSATIDKVTVTLTPPASKDAWQYWLNLTPYGQQLLALLSLAGVGGLYVGGLPERRAFRKVGGVFF